MKAGSVDKKLFEKLIALPNTLYYSLNYATHFDILLSAEGKGLVSAMNYGLRFLKLSFANDPCSSGENQSCGKTMKSSNKLLGHSCF